MINEKYMERIQELSPKLLLLLGLCYAERSQRVVKEFDEYYSEMISDSFNRKLDYAYYSLLNESFVRKDIEVYSLSCDTIK